MSYKNNKFKLSAPTWNLNYLMDHILYQIFKNKDCINIEKT